MRIVINACLGGRDADFAQQRQGPLLRFGGTGIEVRADGFHQLLADRIQRIQRGQRILEDCADAPPADAAHRLIRQVVDTLAFQPDLARGDAAGGLEQADDGRASKRFAGPGFADHAKHFAGRDAEGNPVYRHQCAVARTEFDSQVLYVEDHARLTASSAQLRIEGVAQPVAEQVHR